MTRELHDGRQDGLTPLRTLDLSQIETFADLVEAMAQTAFGGRQLGEALSVLREMVSDADCGVVLTLSGAMTVAKQGKMICDMLDRGWIQAVVSTGALIAHGLTESIGLTHYRYDPRKSDAELFELGYNRIYDTLEMEANLNDVEQFVAETLAEVEPPNGTWCSHSLCAALGRRLEAQNEGPGILRSAAQREVPVYIPAFTDSEVGLDVSIWAILHALAAARRDGGPIDESCAEQVLQGVPAFNPFLDLQHYARFASSFKRLGIFTIGGGVPRNWSQQVAPYIDVTNHRLGTRLPIPRFQYGVRICPEPVHWGGLSGCTYAEGVSWGKFVPRAEGGRYAEVMADATVVLPLLVKAAMEG
ncbi:MAG: deoxyhypusine synthase family protein [Planctomycetota bacterium]